MREGVDDDIPATVILCLRPNGNRLPASRTLFSIETNYTPQIDLIYLCCLDLSSCHPPCLFKISNSYLTSITAPTTPEENKNRPYYYQVHDKHFQVLKLVAVAEINPGRYGSFSHNRGPILVTIRQMFDPPDLLSHRLSITV